MFPVVIVFQSLSCVWLLQPHGQYSTPGTSVFHCLPEFAQILVHWVGDAILTILSSATPFLFYLQSFPASESFFQWVNSLHQVAKVLEPHAVENLSYNCHPLTPLSLGEPLILTGTSGPVSYEVIISSPVSWYAWDPECSL